MSTITTFTGNVNVVRGTNSRVDWSWAPKGHDGMEGPTKARVFTARGTPEFPGTSTIIEATELEDSYNKVKDTVQEALDGKISVPVDCPWMWRRWALEYLNHVMGTSIEDVDGYLPDEVVGAMEVLIALGDIRAHLAYCLYKGQPFNWDAEVKETLRLMKGEPTRDVVFVPWYVKEQFPHPTMM